MNPVILLVEDHEATRFGYARYFSKQGYEIAEATGIQEATSAIKLRRFDAVILDINLPDGNGLDFITTIRAHDVCIPIIVITGSGDIPLAVEAMQRGADNFLVKPVEIAMLSAYLQKTLEVGVMKRRLTDRKRLDKEDDLFFGAGPVMRQILDNARTAASSDKPVLITGETGTGKGLLARWIHNIGSRSTYEFVEINCSSLRGEILSRELFGNARGAFTSADQDRKGLLDVADHGTLFLDEIGDMGVDIQAQFLKVLEDKTYRRLGDVRLFKSNFRLICATHRDIESLLHAGQFRQDLMYRINLMVINLPPLRERMDDLPALVSYLLRGLGSSEAVLSAESMRMLAAYHWPGNVRELKNVLERALLVTPQGVMVNDAHFASLTGSSPGNSPGTMTVQEVEWAHIRAVLGKMGGDVEKAARSLNISRATLYRRLKRMSEMGGGN